MNFYNLKKFFNSYFLALVSLFLILFLTIIVYSEIKERITDRNEKLFAYRTLQAQKAIESRFINYIQILKGSKALFDVSNEVTRMQWKTYVSKLEVDANFKGIQGIGYAGYTPSKKINELINSVKADGFRKFEIKPAGKRDLYFPILYLEPFNGRNMRALGFDMYSDPIRREAMDKAIDANRPALTGKVILLQETTKNIQNGFLLYLPLYRKGIEPRTKEERRKYIKGFVYIPFRANDLMDAIVDNEFPDLEIKIFDSELKNENLLFEKDPNVKISNFKNNPSLKKATRLDIASRTWIIHFSATKKFGATSDNLPNTILISGSIIAFLVFLIMWSLSNTRRSNSLRKTITDNATAALFMLDSKGHVTYMNPAAVEMTGYTFEEISHKPLHEMIHYMHPDGSKYPINDCPIHKKLPIDESVRAHEDVFIRKDNTFFNVSCSVRQIMEDDELISRVLEVRDITEIKEAERMVKENAELLQKVFLKVPAIVGLISGSDLNYILVNPLFSKLYGERSLYGKNIREVTPELGEANLFQVIDKVIETGLPYIGKEIPLTIDRENNGKVKTGYFNIVYQPLLDKNNKVEAVLFFAVEVTELVSGRKNLTLINKELSDKNEQLTKINNDLDNFVYTASHDLKAPISNIEGLIHMLQDLVNEKEENQEVTPILQLINQSISRFKGTIQDLSDITKIQKGHVDDIVEINLREAIKSVEDDINLLIQSSEAKIILELGPINSIRFSQVHLKSILYNLISNAIKYRSVERTPEINIIGEKVQGFKVIHVRDNGLGIKEEHLNKVFGMFKRLHTHVEGTGIGLYIVKRMMENAGGRISLTSEEGKGSVFTLYFPD